ncbi:unnamed protein product [Paramecium pentaurelia]|uniref:Uncharacterized protein n=1 Tax=Paramecium pentaurelia TaxID=43138 RepID=A0A8S1XCU4_9CILI|nr:unnamed protein product [Paramecium pentaurelia]
MENQRIWTNSSNFIKQLKNDCQVNIKEQTQFEEQLRVPIIFDNSCAQCFKRFRKRKLVSNVTQIDPYISEFYYKNQHECFSKNQFSIEKNDDQLQIFQHQKCKIHQYKNTLNCAICDNIISKTNYYKCLKCKAQFFFQNEFNPILECPECNFKFCKLCKRQKHLFNYYECTCYYDYGYTNSFYLLLLIVFQILIFPILVYGKSFQVGMEIASLLIPKVIELYFYTGKYIFLLLILPLIVIYLIVFLVLYWIYILPKSIYLSALDIYDLLAQIYRNFYIE